MAHPHPSRQHVMVTYRRFILGQKTLYMNILRSRKAHRSHVHYRDYVSEYLAAKRDVLGKESKHGE